MMETTGKHMVSQCKGLPLAISTLGGMLRGKTLKEWELINKDISFYLARGEGVDEYHTVTHVLGLSYDSLPPHLRQCFLCLANYNEDEEIKAEELYLFWIAEGLISSEDKAEGEMMLNVAERYLDEFAHRSLVQVEPWEEEGVSWSKFENCRVRDLIQKLCLSKAKEEKVISINNLRHKPDHDSEARHNRIRRLCIHLYVHMDESTVDKTVIPHIRSFLLFNERDDQAEEIFSLEKYKLLRLLKVERFTLSGKSLRSAGKLVYLKYLSFKGCLLVGELPSTIGNLRNLETLDLRVRDEDIRIPNVVGMFKQLKHLYLPDPYFRGSVKDQEKLRFVEMNELELIEGFDSRYCEKHDLIKLSKIKVFQGRIEVNDDNIMIETAIEFIKSKQLCYSSLDIKGKGGVSLILLLEYSSIDYLSIHARITALPKEYDHNGFSGRLDLSLWCSGSEEDPMVLLEKFPYLRHLCFYGDSYMGREMVCSAIGFPQLQTLDLYELPNLINWWIDEGAMPNLSKLQICECEKLDMLPDGLRFLTDLKYLKINSMPTVFSNRIEVTDKVEGQDFYKVRHISTITIGQDDVMGQYASRVY